MKLFLITLLIFFTACSSSPVPRGILQPEKMKKIMYDLIRTDEFVNNFAVKDSSVDIKKKRSILYQQVFNVNNTNRQAFYTSYKYYQQHPDIQKELYDSLFEDINRKKTEPVKAKPADTVKHK